MTLRYALFGKPGNLNEVNDLLKSMHASSVKMEFGIGITDYEAPVSVPACDYTAQTPKGECKFQYPFIAKSSIRQWISALIPFIGDAAILNYENSQVALKQLKEQRNELDKLGIESILVEA